MDYLYSTGRKHCDSRYCRTHAGVAQLFAESPSSEVNAAAWTYVAKAWNDLADFKELIARQKDPGQRLPDNLTGVDKGPSL